MGAALSRGRLSRGRALTAVPVLRFGPALLSRVCALTAVPVSRLGHAGLAQVQLGHALLAKGRREEAVEVFRSGHALQPDHPKTRDLPAQLARLGLSLKADL